MADNDDFEPRLGRPRGDRAPRAPRKFLHRVLAATNLARCGAAIGGRRGGFTGSRIGRGAGVGRVLSMRDRYAAFRQRRVLVKVRPVRLTGKGFGAAKAHMRYIERDGTTRDGGRGQLYGPGTDRVDRKAWLERAKDDRRQFRIIVSPEDGLEYDDLKPLTRRLMARMEEDLGTALDWVAVDHHDTGHPHIHIIVRGKDDRGEDLIIARDYISHGLRERACELVDLDLGPRTDDDIQQRLRAEVDQERLTSIDRSLIRDAETNILVSSEARGPFDQALRTGRLKKLERLGLATQVGAAHWRLAPDLADTLRRMGERGDIIRTMQRVYAARSNAPAIADQVIYDPMAADARPLVGRIVERGLSNEYADRHYMIVEATDGRSHYVEIGFGDGIEPQPAGSIVRIAPVEFGVRQVDRTIADVAATNGGRYTIDAHLRHDPTATERFAETHVRRLEAMRHVAGNVEREPDGTWIIAPDHLTRAAAYEVARAKDRPVTVVGLSSQPLERLVETDAPTWLDRELVTNVPEPLRDAGFGRDAREAQARRRHWLVAQGLANDVAGQWSPQPSMIAALQRRELLRIAGHRLAPWLAHVMVSRQETARPLLTQGEVMQLPPSDELVLVSGMAPIRAKKLRYYEDRNFRERLTPPPQLLSGVYADRPQSRADDWNGMVRAPDDRLAAGVDGASEDEGGLQQQRHPGHEERAAKAEPPKQLELLDPDRDEPDVSADQRVMDRVRTSLVRADALNQGRGRDLLPGF